MKLTFTPQAQQRLQKYLQPDSKLILDFDDGVGPFSKLGNCSLDANFKLIIVKKTPNCLILTPSSLQIWDQSGIRTTRRRSWMRKWRSVSIQRISQCLWLVNSVR